MPYLVKRLVEQLLKQLTPHDRCAFTCGAFAMIVVSRNENLSSMLA